MRLTPVILSLSFLALSAVKADTLPRPIADDTASFSANLLEKFEAEHKAAFPDLADLMETPDRWRYYDRDAGTLIAVSVSQELVFTERTAAEKAMAEVAGRLIRQGGYDTDVTVVFVEPFDAPQPAPPRLPLMPQQIPNYRTAPCQCR